MAALPIEALVAAGLNTAWDLLGDVLQTATLRDGKTISYNAATDVATPTWSINVTKDVFLWEDTKAEREDLITNAKHPPKTTKAILRQIDFPAIPSTEAQLEVGVKTYQVTAVEEIPASSIWILTLITF